ncbi:uncharacterized protein FOMMEDRAFT_148616 [Fomitiporia mediterranea MF3/22]|uniref:uncharacterized protein n=1 Tax=Fomitiporia mediterranea (strain MF3/22) TaxID=694068 RepID=UPI0004408AE0|nr:uncharacterized protein FOMMEDRAFT_148616 [Fomitiporia mediterranea MF3/22]EJC99793.1 hypothetical protein FOMMEDRAFT_148616 [Fomitiporia mediterranea MF3/22]
MFKRTLNKKVEEATSKLSELDSTLEDEKGLTLDENPTTEDPITVYIRHERNLIGDDLKTVTEETRKAGYFKRQNKDEVILQTLHQLIDRIDLLRQTVTVEQDLGIVAELAFKEDPRKSECLSELLCRSPVWVTVNNWESLRTKFTVCEKLSLDESQLIHWWHGNGSIEEVSSVLDNMSNLARKIVLLREKGESLDSHTTPDLDLVQLLIKFPDHEHELVDIFILLVFTTFTMTSIVSKDPEDIAASNTILKELVTKLEDLCASFHLNETIGGRLGAQPYIDAANNANMNSSTKPNFSTLASSVDEFELDKANALITTGLVPNRSRLQKMMSKFTDKLRVTTFQTLSNVEQKPFIPTRRFSIQDLVDMKLQKIDLNFSKSKYLGTGSMLSRNLSASIRALINELGTGLFVKQKIGLNSNISIFAVSTATAKYLAMCSQDLSWMNVLIVLIST